jgi:molybdopterin/thiamine biosynthesis adenylyltransferase
MILKGKINTSEEAFTMAEYDEQWTSHYRDLVNRNIGLISEEQQEKMRTSRMSVLGLGGIGGTAFEILVRCGVENFSIVDRDSFEPTNLNRQIFALPHTMGKMKIDVAEEWAQKMNPGVMVEKYDHVGEDNISDILKDSDVVVLAIDELKPCLIISRKARELGIPLVEGWAIPYGNVRTFTSQTPTLEKAYGLPTSERKISDIPEEELKQLGLKVMLDLGKIEGIPDFYTDEVVRRIAMGHISSFAPMVWLTSVLMALEAVKVLLNWGKIAQGPRFTLYDPFAHRVPKIFDEIPADRVNP